MSRQRNNDARRRRQRHLVAAGVLANAGVLAVIGAASYSYADSGWTVETTVTVDGVTGQASPSRSEAVAQPVSPRKAPTIATGPTSTQPGDAQPGDAQPSSTPGAVASEPRIEATAIANPDPGNSPSMPPTESTPSSTTPAE